MFGRLAVVTDEPSTSTTRIGPRHCWQWGFSVRANAIRVESGDQAGSINELPAVVIERLCRTRLRIDPDEQLAREDGEPAAIRRNARRTKGHACCAWARQSDRPLVHRSTSRWTVHRARASNRFAGGRPPDEPSSPLAARTWSGKGVKDDHARLALGPRWRGSDPVESEVSTVGRTGRERGIDRRATMPIPDAG